MVVVSDVWSDFPVSYTYPLLFYFCGWSMAPPGAGPDSLPNSSLCASDSALKQFFNTFGAISVSCVCVCVCVLVAQSCQILCNPMDCRPPGSSVHKILQARILEWVAILFSSGLPGPGIKPRPPALQADSLPSEPQGSPSVYYLQINLPDTLNAKARWRWLLVKGGVWKVELWWKPWLPSPPAHDWTCSSEHLPLLVSKNQHPGNRGLSSQGLALPVRAINMFCKPELLTTRSSVLSWGVMVL